MKHRIGPSLLIGIVGAADSGAEQCANILAEAYHFAKVSLGDCVRAEASKAFGMDARTLTQADRADIPCHALRADRCTDREFQKVLLQRGHQSGQPLTPTTVLKHWEYGYRRLQSGSNYWAEEALRGVLSARDDHGFRRQVIYDIKHMSDANTIRSVGGLLWRAQRASHPVDPDSELGAIAVAHSINTDLTPACLIYDVLAAYRSFVDALLSTAGANHA